MRFLPWTKRLKTLLLACKDQKSIAKIHAFVILTGLFTNGNSAAQLIASYARLSDIKTALQLFDKLPRRGVDVWNAMIIAYSRKDFPVEVLAIYNQMVLEGVRPDSTTFTVVLRACASLSDLEMGEEIWCQAVDCGYEYDMFVGSSVLNLYAKCGKMNEAMVVFEKMPRRDIVCWTTMITGFAQRGWARDAVDIYRWMQAEGMEGDEVVMVGSIQACANLGYSKLCFSVHGYIIRRAICLDVVVQTCLVDIYAKNGHLALASRVFKNMPHKNAISWGALISGFAQNGLPGNVLELLVEMQSFGFKPDSVSIVSGLLACSQIGSLKMGKAIHGYIVRRIDFDQVLATAVIGMYSKCGVLSCAHALFDRITSRDRVLWNAMIDGYGVHGHGKEALSLFLRMTETNIKPDHATFASLLSAFSHSGLIEEGQYCFDLMVSRYNIQPSEKHYACMVDLFARSGRVEEARDLIDSMKTEPGLAVWVALLSGCHNHRKLLIGEMAAKKVIELDPDDLGIFTLVSNFFALARKWDEVAGVRKTMKTTAMKKVPGYSVVQVNGKLHAFSMEDKSHHHYEDIIQILDKLDHDMRARGYILD